jgi:ABC-type lipoprotein export system ATPase subunit
VKTHLDSSTPVSREFTNVPLVRCAGLARTFGRGSSAVVALHHATCEIEAGQLVALVGPSGSGKSTLLHLLAGLDSPTAGTLEWPALADAPLRPGPVAVVFQAPSLLAPLDVLENVALPLLLAGAERAPANEAALAALRALGLDTIATKLPDELSGGQAQRVAIARALAGSPRLILADEPTGQLDHDTAAAVVDALIAAAERSGAALVIATHDHDIATRFTTRWRVADGRLYTDGPGR